MTKTLRLTLPSRRVVVLHMAPASASSSGRAGGMAAALSALRAARITDAHERLLEATTLTLEDAQVLRVALAQSRGLREPEVERACENCGAMCRARPSDHVALGPFRDGELDDAELDAPFDFEVEHPLGPVRAAGRIVRGAELSPRTLGEAAALWERDRTTPSRALVSSLGVRALGGERRAGAIADMLREPRCFDEVARLWLDAHYCPRLVGLVRCESCGAQVSFPAPAERELPEPPPPQHREGFPDIADFEALVRRLAPRQFRLARARNVDLVVDDDVPHCDEGGVPLLGSYLPASRADEAGPVRPAEVRLYYRTFKSEWERDPSFELRAEVDETLRHELEHHGHALAGFDPMDDDEQGAIATEERRRVGSRAQRERVAGAAAGDLVEFVKRTWILWLAIFAIVAWILEQGR